jgi:lysosomal alpha-glucosidase
MYTILWECEQFGGTLIRPLFFEFPTDDQTFLDPENTFMIGHGLKISPVLIQGLKTTDTFKSYFPKGKWAALHDGKVLESSG